MNGTGNDRPCSSFFPPILLLIIGRTFVQTFAIAAPTLIMSGGKTVNRFAAHDSTSHGNIYLIFPRFYFAPPLPPTTVLIASGGWGERREDRGDLRAIRRCGSGLTVGRRRAGRRGRLHAVRADEPVRRLSLPGKVQQPKIPVGRKCTFLDGEPG